MACCQFGIQPLSESMQTYLQLNPEEHTWIEFYLEFKSFHSNKMFLKMSVCEMVAIESQPLGVKGCYNDTQQYPQTINLYEITVTYAPLVPILYYY